MPHAKTSCQQALLAWLFRSPDRNFWIENLSNRRLKLSMQENHTGVGGAKIARSYMDFEPDPSGDIPDFVIDDLIKRGLDQWLKNYRNLH